MKTTFFLSKPLREIGHAIAQYWFFIFDRRHHEQWINCFIASQWNIQNQVYNFNKISNSLSRKKWEWFRRIATNANQERQHIVESLQSSRPSFMFHSILIETAGIQAFEHFLTLQGLTFEHITIYCQSPFERV